MDVGIRQGGLPLPTLRCTKELFSSLPSLYVHMYIYISSLKAITLAHAALHQRIALLSHVILFIIVVVILSVVISVALLSVVVIIIDSVVIITIASLVS